jgi:hypothetical protein
MTADVISHQHEVGSQIGCLSIPLSVVQAQRVSEHDDGCRIEAFDAVEAGDVVEGNERHFVIGSGAAFPRGFGMVGECRFDEREC